MILKRSITALVASAVATTSIGVGIGFAQPNNSGENVTVRSFACQPNANGTPTTFAIMSNGEKRQFIRWVSDDFTLAGYPPQDRCEQVSSRMNQYVASGKRYTRITHGTMRNPKNGRYYPVICVTERRGGDCTGLLYTLRHDQNRRPIEDGRETLRQLLVLNRNDFSGDPRLEGESCRIYVSIRAIIQNETKKAEEVCNAR